MGRLLFLDLATRVGWASGVPGSDRPVVYGEWHLSASHGIGGKLAALADAVIALMAVWGEDDEPVLIGYEAPLFMKGKTNIDAIRQQFILAAKVEELGYRWCIPTKAISVHDARRSELGAANFGGRDHAKNAAMAWAKACGYRVPGDNAADALVGLHHMARVIARKPWPDPKTFWAGAGTVKDKRQVFLSE